MFYALDETNARTSIDDADKKKKYHCPCCDYPVIVRQGEVNAWHYAHKPGSICDAAFTEKTIWHRNWQERFPPECREVINQDLLGYKRIADVKINGTTIEFQKSSIQKDLFDERNRHHLRTSSEVLWVFDCTDKDIELYSKAYEDDGVFEDKWWCKWKYPNRMLAKYIYQTWSKKCSIQDKETQETFKGVSIFLQINKSALLKLMYLKPYRQNVGWFLGKIIDIDVFTYELICDYRPIEYKPEQLSMII